MWCFIAHVYNGRERERRRERERERETERVPRRIILFTMRWELHYICVYPTIFSCVDPRPQLSRFFTGISRRRYVACVYNGELISLIGNQRVGIFPPKSEILFVPSLALIWCRNFQDRTIPVGGDTWPSFWRKERRITEYTSARQYVMPYEKKTREQKSRTVTWQFADFQTTFFRLSNQVGGDATVGRLSNNCFPRYQAIGRIFEKSHWTVTRQWLRSRDRRPTVK